MMERRAILAASAAVLAAPRIGLAQRARPLRFVPFADLPALDPMASPSTLTRDAGMMIYDTLFALDADLRPQPQMLESFRTEADGLVTGRAKMVRPEFVEKIKQSEHWQHQRMVPNELIESADIWV